MAVGANYLEMTGGSAGAAGTGAFTIAALVQPAVGNSNMGVTTLLATGTRQRSAFIDALKLFTENDFSGFGSVTLGQYHVLVVSKAAGAAQTVSFEIWPYASDGSGVMATGTDGTNLGDGSAVNQIRFGQALDNANGLYSVLGIWTRQLTAPERQSLKTNLLSVWAGLSPAELIHTKNWNGTTGITTAVGTSTFVGVTGTVGVGADPSGFDFTLGGAGASPNGIGVPVVLGSPTVSAVLTAVPSSLAVAVRLGNPRAGDAPISTDGGGWYGLLSVLKEGSANKRIRESLPPTACPHDGEPLQNDGRGGLMCRFDGWRWPADGGAIR